MWLPTQKSSLGIPSCVEDSVKFHTKRYLIENVPEGEMALDTCYTQDLEELGIKSF